MMSASSSKLWILDDHDNSIGTKISFRSLISDDDSGGAGQLHGMKVVAI